MRNFLIGCALAVPMVVAVLLGAYELSKEASAKSASTVVTMPSRAY